MKKVLVTGGSGDIGEAIVTAFAKNYEVAFTYFNNNERANAIAEKTGATAHKCDISDRRQVENLVSITGGRDILVNNAGISQYKLFTDIAGCEWDKMIDVNLTGSYNVIYAYLPHMIHQKAGAIVNISSVWGVYGASCEVHYSAAKAGIIGLTKALAKEVGLSGITVNAVAPGVISGRMNSHLSDSELEDLKNETPLYKIGKPNDVAEAVVFLAEAGFITGQVLGVDGGFGL